MVSGELPKKLELLLLAIICFLLVNVPYHCQHWTANTQLNTTVVRALLSLNFTGMMYGCHKIGLLYTSLERMHVLSNNLFESLCTL